MRTLVQSFPVIVGLALAGAASADTITAEYGIPGGYLSTSFSLLGGPQTPIATVNQGHRLDAPGPGVDSTIPGVFPTYCVELGEIVTVGTLPSYYGSYTHNVSPLFGSTTVTGGITGPISFDLGRTDRLELLWGLFQPSLATTQDHAAFQVAVWKITFDSSLNLFDNTSVMYYGASDPISSQAQGYLDLVAAGVGPRASLTLMSGAGLQDLITVIPTPGSLALLGLGGLFAFRRR